MIPATPDPVEIDPGRHDLGVHVRVALDAPAITADVHVFLNHDGEEWITDDGIHMKDLTSVVRSCTRIVGAWRDDKPMRTRDLTAEQRRDLTEAAEADALDAWKGGQVGAR